MTRRDMLVALHQSEIMAGDLIEARVHKALRQPLFGKERDVRLVEEACLRHLELTHQQPGADVKVRNVRDAHDEWRVLDERERLAKGAEQLSRTRQMLDDIQHQHCCDSAILCECREHFTEAGEVRQVTDPRIDATGLHCGDSVRIEIQADIVETQLLQRFGDWRLTATEVDDQSIARGETLLDQVGGMAVRCACRKLEVITALRRGLVAKRMGEWCRHLPRSDGWHSCRKQTLRPEPHPELRSGGCRPSRTHGIHPAPR